MRKILVFVGSRANHGRLKKVIENIQASDKLELQLMLGASFYNADIGIEPVSRIQCLCDGDDHESMVIGAATMLNRVAMELARLKPDLVFVHGDRFEVLPVAQAAYYMNIPVAHTEGGEDSGCIDDGIRNMITAIATYNFVTNDASLQKLISIGKAKVWNVGSTGIDNLIEGKIKTHAKRQYLLILHHPNTTEEEDIEPLIKAVCPANNFRYYKKVWINPNFDAGSKKILKLIKEQDNILFLKNLKPAEYYKLLANASCTIGNSSSFLKEGAFFGIPCVLLGDRQKNRIHADNIFPCKMDEQEISSTLKIAAKASIKPSYMFGDGTASNKIVEILEREVI